MLTTILCIIPPNMALARGRRSAAGRGSGSCPERVGQPGSGREGVSPRILFRAGGWERRHSGIC